MVSPFVEVEICGADYDNTKFKTKTISDNGFNPVWDEFFDFTCKNPDLALIRYESENMPRVVKSLLNTVKVA